MKKTKGREGKMIEKDSNTDNARRVWSAWRTPAQCNVFSP